MSSFSVDLINEFVSRFDDADQYTAAIIITDRLGVAIIEQPDWLEGDNTGGSYAVACSEFPDFYIDTMLTHQQATDLVQYYQLEVQ